ncbi:HNH endonuclease [Halalkalibacterium halodurans]|uniref:HNH endonuclease n=1 Tax=Halalkalibacterium halodurans TaxID=86665 RepID=UPI002E1B3AAF|nr:HNH endonuclease [Halalkalibacterium halodurans]
MQNKALNKMLAVFMSFLLISGMILPSIGHAATTEDDPKDIYESNDERYWEDDEYYFEDDEDYSQFLIEHEENIFDITGDYADDYFTDDSIDSIELPADFDDSDAEIIFDGSKFNTGNDQFEAEALPFLLPALAPVVVRVGGQLLVRQYLTSTTRNIAIRNASLAGRVHSSGVRFNANGFPIFSSRFTWTIPNSMLKASNSTHFRHTNQALLNEVNRNGSLRLRFTTAQYRDILAGKTPRGYTWHHHEMRGRMQLVETSIHRATGHTGGRAIWGTW